jgi:hypothetical protein
MNVAKNRVIRTRSVGIVGRSTSVMRRCARGPMYSCKHIAYMWESVDMVRCSNSRFVCACVRRLVLMWDIWTNGVTVCGTVVVGPVAVAFRKHRTLAGTKKRVRETLETRVLGEREPTVSIYVWHAAGVSTRVHFWSTWEAPVINR